MTRRRFPSLAIPVRRRAAALVVFTAMLGDAPVTAQAESVIDTLHNLSISGPGRIKAVSETEVCKFCHIPHNAVVPVPLWGHALSDEQYAVPEVRVDGSAREPAPQPDGDSRLCLSCHDGTVALGKIAGESGPIPMVGAQRLTPGDKGFLGTDLTGSHPISFVVPDFIELDQGDDTDIVSKPRGEIEASSLVRLDENDKMQCTTCHDAHSDRFYRPDRVPRFWVAPTVDEVCISCHVLR